MDDFPKTAPAGEPSRHFLTRDECQKLLNTCVSLSSGGGDVHLSIESAWIGAVQWARSRAFASRDVHRTRVWITRTIRGAVATASTNRLDDQGLQDLVRMAERELVYSLEQFGKGYTPTIDPILNPLLWSDTTYTFDGERRGAAVRALLEPAEAAGVLSSGELRVTAKGNAALNTQGMFRYYPTTSVSISTAARNPRAGASGWAGVNDFDIHRVDIPALASRALTKCQTSGNPVALEPGHYTAILESQAVADLFARLLGHSAMYRNFAEQPAGPFGVSPGRTRINQRVLDPRMTISHDPMDPIGGFLPFHPRTGVPYYPVNWVEHGTLRNLAYPKYYGLQRLHLDTPLENSASWSMAGGTTSVDEMIASTSRGILVTRFSRVEVLDSRSFTCTGLTRDGTWLIEQGKITKAIKNFRFVESPLFVFNKLEQIGVPQRVFSPDDDQAWVAPPAKVADFNFTQIADAV